MNGDVTVREVMKREFVGVSEPDTLGDVGKLMLEEDVEAVVVLRGSSPEGMVTQQDVLEAAVEGADLDSVAVSDAMDPDPPSVRPAASLAAATDEMSGLPTRHLLVEDNGEVVGLISEYDVVTASSLDPGVDSDAREADEEPMVTERTAGPGQVEAAATDQGYSNQGICEVCGSLTRDLSSFNGQLVCSDCKDV